jgi:opacity protein-like surface antigen
MKHTSALVALAFTTALVSAAASANQPWPNWYVGLTGSVGFLTDSDVAGAGAGIHRGLTYGTGWGAGASLGYMPATDTEILRDMRFEGEIYYHKNNIEDIKTTGATISGLNGVASTSYMFNAYYALPTAGALKPYIGGGLGVTTLDLSTVSGLGNTNTSDTKLSYQGMAGVAYSFASVPDVEWTLGYRYLGMRKASYASAGGPITLDYSLHDLEAGAKFRF